MRCFEDGNVVHVAGKVDPADDVETINLELGLRDLQQIEQKLERNTKSRVKGSPAETEALEKAAAVLNDGLPLRSADLTPEEVTTKRMRPAASRICSHFLRSQSKQLMHRTMP